MLAELMREKLETEAERVDEKLLEQNHRALFEAGLDIALDELRVCYTSMRAAEQNNSSISTCSVS